MYRTSSAGKSDSRSASSPSAKSSSNDFLWRIHRHAPRLGEFAIFNRSHYEDVLVARVHDLVPRSTWKERYGHIRDFEELLAEHGAVVLKYFLHIAKGEQEQRLLEREESPDTAWKLNPNDWKERDHWDEYTEAYEDAISKTAAKHAPWTIVPANAKWYRDLVVAESIVDALKRRRSDWEKTLAAMGKAGKADLRTYCSTRRPRCATARWTARRPTARFRPMRLSRSADDEPGDDGGTLPASGVQDAHEKGLLSTERVKLMKSWEHSGFNIEASVRIGADDATGRKNLARYLIRAPFSGEKITYNANEGTVIYKTKRAAGANGNFETFDPLDFLAAAFLLSRLFFLCPLARFPVTTP